MIKSDYLEEESIEYCTPEIAKSFIEECNEPPFDKYKEHLNGCSVFNNFEKAYKKFKEYVSREIPEDI